MKLDYNEVDQFYKNKSGQQFYWTNGSERFRTVQNVSERLRTVQNGSERFRTVQNGYETLW